MLDLRGGPDTNFYEIAAFVDMLLAIIVSVASMFGIYYDWAHHGALPETSIGIGVALAVLSSFGLILGFAKNRSSDKRIAVLTLACSLMIPCWTLTAVGIGRWNVVLTMLVGPGILLGILSCAKLMQLQDASHCA